MSRSYNNKSCKGTGAVITALLDSNVSLYAVPGATDAALAFLSAKLLEKGGALNLSAVYDGNASADDIYIRLALQKLTGIQGSDEPQVYYQGLSDVIRYAGGPIIDPGEVMNFDQTMMDGITQAVQVRTAALQTNQVAKFFEDNNAVMNMLSDRIGYAATLALGYKPYTERVAADKASQKLFAEEPALTTEQQLTQFAGDANSAISGKGPVVGTLKHSLFKKMVDSMGKLNIETEQTFVDGLIKKYGTKGGVRVDAIEYNADGTITVYDLKTGSAALTPNRIAQIQNAVRPKAPESVTVIQI